MFCAEIYIQRRAELRQRVGGGIVLLFGNNDSPYNYAANAYHFRQDSTFLYYFGLRREGLAGVIDIDNDTECVYGNDIDLNDIVWTGTTPSVSELAAQAGVARTAPMKDLSAFVLAAREKGRRIHFLPQYRHDIMIQLADMVGTHPLQMREHASTTLIKAVVAMRSVKRPEEIKQLWLAADVGHMMHTEAMRLCVPGATEKRIAGAIEGIATSYGEFYSFPAIVTTHGEILHCSPSCRPLENGRMMLCDAGVENAEGYCSDHTRVTPVSGRFSSRQRDMYIAVENAHDWILSHARSGVKWFDIHLGAALVLTEHLKSFGLMKGNPEDAVEAGAYALFSPCGMGHMMGLDVHDMENLGQEFVGFDDEVRPSTQFGLNHLRFGRRLQNGFVMTNEPGLYIIPDLIASWRAEKRHKDFINYDALDAYEDFGGIRIENDILITDSGCEVIGGRMIPYHIDDVEDFVKECRENKQS